MFNLKNLLLAATATASFAAAAPAAVIQVDSGTRIFTLSSADPVGQSFLAPGAQLASIGLQFATLNPSAAASTVTLTLREGAGLGGTILSQQVVTPVNVGRDDPKLFTDFAFAGVTLTPGAAYTITLLNSGESARNGLVFGPNLINPPFGSTFGPDPYVDGRLFFTGSLGGCGSNPPSCDLNFRVTTLDSSAAVPEPATWAMMIGGFGMVGGALRRRNQQAALA